MKVIAQIIGMIIYLTLSNLVFASNITQPYFQNIADDSSIPYGIVTATINDKNGFLWIGTQQGLLRYDGYKYRHFKHQPENSNSLSGNNIRSLLIARDGNIWIGTTNAGISIFDPISETFTHLSHDSNKKHSLINNHINKIIEGQNGVFYIATLKGFDSYNPQSKNFHHYQKINSPMLRSDIIVTLMLDQQENLWIGTNRGVNFLPKNSATISDLSDTLEDNDDFLKQITLSFIEDDKGNVWQGTASGGIGVIDIDANKINKVVFPFKVRRNIRSMLQVSPSQVWVSVSGVGVFQINTENYSVDAHYEASLAAPASLSSLRVNTMHKSSDGIIWLGHYGAGLDKVVPNNTFSTYQANVGSMRFLNVHSIHETTDEKIWLGTEHGIEILDKATGKTSKFSATNDEREFLSANILSLEEVDNTLWIASKRGLFKTIVGTSQFEKHDVFYNGKRFKRAKILASKNQHLWLYNFQSVFRMNIKTNEVIKYNPSIKNGETFSIAKINNVFEDDSGRLWIASSSGVFLIRPEKNNKVLKVKMVDVNHQDIMLNSVISIMSGTKNDIWIDASQGLFNISKIEDNIITLVKAPLKFKRKHSQRFSNIQIDRQGRVWMSNAMYDPKTKKTWEFNQADGVDIGTNWIRSSGKTTTGQLIFGGTKGAVIVNPDNFTPWAYQPLVVMTEFRLDGAVQLFSSGKPLLIDKNSSNISIDFSSLDYSDPDLLEYQYKLEGYDQLFTQTELGTHSVTYTNLSPGDYHLWVKATNRIGFWGDKTQLVSFTVPPHFFETWWFKLVVGSIFILLFYLLHKIQLHKRLANKQKENDRTMALERAELMSELIEKKNKLLADVSHELRTPLTVLKLQVESLQHNLDDDVEASYRALDEKLSDIGRLISDIYQLAKSDIGALELNLCELEFPKALNDYVNEFELLVTSNNLSWRFDNKITRSISINADYDRIKQVLCNLINNSVKYTDSPGVVVLSAHCNESQLIIVIEDSSPSVPAELQSQIFERLYRVEESRSRETGGSGLGLAICKSLIEAHNGIITATTSSKGGIKVTIQLPLC